MIVDLATHAKSVARHNRSESQARKDALLLRYRSFIVQVGCTLAAIERAEKTFVSDAAVDAAIRIGLGNIKFAHEQLVKNKDV